MITTKDQEREALAKIKAIVEGLGADSYLSITFAGCFEQAEDNINNDFGNNYKELYEAADARHYDAMKELEAEQEKSRDLEEQIKTLNGFHEEKKSKIEELKAHNERLIESNSKQIDEIDQLTADIEALKAEIITLKAKLYDLITA